MDIYAIFIDPAVNTLTDATYFGTGAANTYPSPSSYDTAATGVPAAVGPGGTIGGPLLHDIGRGMPKLRFFNQITVAVTSAGAATVEVDFIDADDGALSVNVTTLLQSPAIAKANLVIGYRYRHGSVPGVTGRRYWGAQVVIGTATITAGALYSALVLDVDDHADLLG